jgi:hypothetical protein
MEDLSTVQVLEAQIQNAQGELKLERSYLGNHSIALLIDRMNTLQSLSIVGCAMMDVDFARIVAALGKNTSITKMDLSVHHATQECNPNTFTVGIAAALCINKTLKELKLCYSGIGDEGAVCIAAALIVNQSLTTLDLSYNDFGDEGATALAAAAEQHPGMTVVLEENPMITPAIQARLAAAPARAAQNRQVLAFVGAVVPGRPRARTPAQAFVWADGDTALAHRVARFFI